MSSRKARPALTKAIRPGTTAGGVWSRHLFPGGIPGSKYVNHAGKQQHLGCFDDEHEDQEILREKDPVVSPDADLQEAFTDARGRLDRPRAPPAGPARVSTLFYRAVVTVSSYSSEFQVVWTEFRQF